MPHCGSAARSEQCPLSTLSGRSTRLVRPPSPALVGARPCNARRGRREEQEGDLADQLGACPGAQVPVAFIGEAPADYKHLTEVASQRKQVVVFDAVADGFIVQERDVDLVFILLSLDKLRESPGATARAKAASRCCPLSTHFCR